MKKLKAYPIILRDDDKEIIEKLKQLTGLFNTSDIIRQALRYHRNGLEPLYIQEKAKHKTRPVYETEADRIKAKQEKIMKENELKVALEEERQLGICQALDGLITKQEDGTLMCTWKQYNKYTKDRVEVGEIGKSIGLLHESMIERQFKGGTKEEILAILEKNGKN